MFEEWDYEWLEHMDSEHPIYWDDDFDPEPLEWRDA